MAYQSQYTGEQIEAALGVIVGSLEEFGTFAEAEAVRAAAFAVSEDGREAVFDAAEVARNASQATREAALQAKADQVMEVNPDGTYYAKGAIDNSLNLMTRTEFEAVAGHRRSHYAGSGFVEWGRSRTNYSGVNEGLFCGPNAASHMEGLMLGHTIANSSVIDTSRSGHAVVHVNGFLLRLWGTNAGGGDFGAKLLFPPAPATSALLDRQDLVFLEVWHEDISEKNFVYPYGNIQYGPTTYTKPDGTTIATVNGAFAGASTYSLFGNWQAASALIGRGMVWSTMTDANKRAFVSDPENNIYLDGTKVVQVRYRIRVVEGLGSAWSNVFAELSPQALRYASGQTVKPKGKLPAITVDVGADAGNESGWFLSAKYLTSIGSGVYAAAAKSSTTSLDTTIAHNGLCFALPIALVHRRNQGAYHPVFNPNGTGKVWSATIDTNYDFWYTSGRQSINSTADCFLIGSYPNTGLVNKAFGGFIAAAAVGNGRPDGLFYDEINERDVKDLRNSALVVDDLGRCLEREFNKLVAGTVRGWSNSPFMFKHAQPRTAAETAFFSFNNGDELVIYENVAGTSKWVGAYAPIGSSIVIYIPSNGFNTYANIGNYSGSEIKWKRRTGTYAPASGGVVNEAGYYILCEPTLGSLPTYVNAYSWYKRPSASKTLLHCDIIGDPANYPQSWKDNGVAGTPLLVSGDGTSLIPTGALSSFKLSRKANATPALVLRSTNQGATWATVTPTFSTTTNILTLTNEPAANIVMVFYLTEASPLELATNASVLNLGNVYGTNSQFIAQGALLSSFLIGKIPTNGDTDSTFGLWNEQPLTQRPGVDRLTNVIVTAARESYYPKHGVIQLFPKDTPAIKALPYLTRANGKLYLQMLYKEMVHNGSSWGDDNKFNVVDNESTVTDLNAKKVKVGQKRLELPFFVRDGR